MVPNSVVLRLPVIGDAPLLYTPDRALAIVEALVTAWEPGLGDVHQPRPSKGPVRCTWAGGSRLGDLPCAAAPVSSMPSSVRGPS